MIKFGLVAAISMSIACNQSADTDRHVGTNGAVNTAVYLIGWNVETITGRHEFDFPGNIRPSCVNDLGFVNLLVESIGDHFYDSQHVKAKIVTQSGVIYYVDFRGVVRSGSQIFTIDRMKFLNYIRRFDSDDSSCAGLR
jgi:hypothetical protein